MINADAAEVYGMVKNLALGGDLQACKETLSRAWPVWRKAPNELRSRKIPWRVHNGCTRKMWPQIDGLKFLASH